MDVWRHYGSPPSNFKIKIPTHATTKPEGYYASKISEQLCKNYDWYSDSEFVNFVLKPTAHIFELNEISFHKLRREMGRSVELFYFNDLKEQGYDGLHIHGINQTTGNLHTALDLYKSLYDMDTLVIWNLDAIELMK